MDNSQAAILGSLIAASVTIITFVISKESKISEFRQGWIDQLRADISDGLASLSALVVLLNQVDIENEAYQRAWLKAKTSIARVRLRLNANEPAHQHFASLLDDVTNRVRNALDTGMQGQEFEQIERKVIVQSQSLLKSEWERVKKGEPSYNRAKGIAWFAMLFLAVYSMIEYLAH